MKNKYFLVGLGMIGSSYAKRLSDLGYDVYGFDIDDKTNKQAVSLGYIKDYGLKYIKNSDLVILTLYPTLNYKFVKENINYFQGVKLVTDVAGIKNNYINELIEILPKDTNYLSHHPMAGSEKSGINAADEKVFIDANFLIVTDDEPDKESLKVLLNLKDDLGFKTASIIDAKTHDLLISFTSQLPHMIAVALVNSDIYKTTKDFSGDSYKDLTRIANINERLWTELFFSNKENLLSEMKRFQEEFNKLLNSLQTNNDKKLKEKLISAKEKGEVIVTKLNVSTSYYNYNIYVGNKLKINEFFKPHINQTLFIITDSNLHVLYEDYLQETFNGFNYHIIVVEAGEKSKSFKVYDELINVLLKKEMTKKDLIVSFGGGVVGDLAGFIAGTIFRGVKFINIPTTLLAMSDSSIGGKTGIDTRYGKNLVGVFKQPEFVIIDTFYLNTLDKNEYSNGMAEIIKAGLIADKNLIDYLLKDKIVNTEIILRALEVKKRIVEEDPYEENIRMLLNFGHTFGHAIEQYYDYKLRHGYCVALGMDLAIRYGIKIKMTNREIPNVLKTLYKKYNLEEFKGDSNVYLNNIKYDKKNYNEHLNFIILTKIGQAEIIKIKEEDLNDLSS